MQRVSEFTFYELSSAIHPLTELELPKTFSQVWFDWMQAKTALTTIFAQRPFGVSQSVGQELYDALSAVVPDDIDEVRKKFPVAQPEEPLPPWQVSTVKTLAAKFETVLGAECLVMDTYFISKKGSYSTADLVERAHITIPEPYQSKLPAQATVDFDQAGKCLAFDLPTAAAFHLMRASEAVIRAYYQHVVGTLPKPKMRNWGAYIKNLKQANASSKVADLLQHLKDAYRNPVFHPEETYSEQQAQVLFGICVSATVLMMQEMESTAAKSPALPFPISLVATGKP